VSQLRVEFYAIVELPTGDTVTVPLEGLTYEETIETDIFDEGDPGSSTATDESDGAGSGGASTPTATEHGGSDETETETETEATTTTATESGDASTDTPDGGGLLPS
jgi:hypothetical protein